MMLTDATGAGRVRRIWQAALVALLATLAPACAGDRGDCAEDGCGDEQVAPLAGTRVRIVAGNITSGNAQSYTPGEGTRIFDGLNPDIAMIQEFNYGTNSASDIRTFINAAFGSTFVYFREGGSKQIPNGVASRYPIRASGAWDDPQVSNREFAWARIDVPGTPDLWAISVHFLTSSTTARTAEANALVSFIRNNVPSSDYVALAGDLNTGSRTEGCITALASAFVTAGPYPQDASGNGNTNASRSKPYDWVLVNGKLDALETSVQIGSASFTNGLVFDSRVFTPLSAVSPVRSSDSSATNMQHMAVVRDFVLP